MKKTLLILILFSNYTFAQNKPVKQAIPQQVVSKPKAPKLPVFNDIIDITSLMNKTCWSLDVQNENEYNKPAKPEEVILSIDSIILSEKGNPGELYYLKKYKKAIDSIFNNMKLIGSSLGEFVYLKKVEIPVKICTYNDTSKIFLITGIALHNVYNTLRLTSRQRATKVITTYLIPSLKAMKPIINKEFKYLGLGAVFASKDFSSESALATQAEYILFVVPSQMANAFIKGEITEDELVESAEIISSDRDMVTDTKRIKITLE